MDMLTIAVLEFGTESKVNEWIFALWLVAHLSIAYQHIFETQVVVHVAKAMQMLELIKEWNTDLTNIIGTQDTIIAFLNLWFQSLAQQFHNYKRVMLQGHLTFLLRSISHQIAFRNCKLSLSINFRKIEIAMRSQIRKFL